MRVLDLGRMAYEPAWEVQKSVAQDVIDGQADTLILVEHDPVLTLGANFHESSLLFTVEQYKRMGIEVVRTDRGGDVTFHGPGQLVIYPIFDLKRHGQDLHRWMRDLEEAVIAALATFGIEGWRFPPHTGVWTGSHESQSDPPRKIAAIGVKVRKWVSIHGIAINVENAMNEFGLIVPCGIVGYGVTNVNKVSQTGTTTVHGLKPAVMEAFSKVFGPTSNGVQMLEALTQDLT